MTFKIFLRLCILGWAVYQPIAFVAFDSLFGFKIIQGNTILIACMLAVWILAMWKLWDITDHA